ncbi:hypothetical protein EAF04_000887 [Stromatinia cepivora]|nr:hypothetical protein EAF04_000887 [Stromatinia cepivora]
MKNFFITFCLLASIAVVAEQMSPGSPTKPSPFDVDSENLWNLTYWTLDLNCAFDRRSNDLHCRWVDWASEDPIPTQPVRKDFRFKLSSKVQQREADIWEPYSSHDFDVIKVDPMMLPAEFDRKERELGTTDVIFPMKVSCLRTYGLSSILWCERWMQDTKRRAHELSELNEL